MIIEWQTDLYRRIRENFQNRYRDLSFYTIPSLFINELHDHGADMVVADNATEGVWLPGNVTDSLGMNNNICIRFTDERQYTWFILKWS